MNIKGLQHKIENKLITAEEGKTWESRFIALCYLVDLFGDKKYRLKFPKLYNHYRRIKDDSCTGR